MNKSKLVKKWEGTGLLDDLSRVDEKERCSEILEMTVNCGVETYNSQAILIPCIYVLFKKHNLQKSNVKEACLKIETVWNQYKGNIDEIEFCRRISEFLI